MEPKPDFDIDVAAGLIGKYVLVGMTYLSKSKEAIEYAQKHGVVKIADHRGVCISLRGMHDGEDLWLPPDLRSFKPAPPGEYVLKGTGEIVKNPDFITTWTVENSK